MSRDDLRDYARDYYHHVNAFPTYLAELSMRLEESELRRAVLANLADEKGCDDATGNNPEHAELWLDFAEGMGASRNLRGHQPVAEIKNLMAFFHDVASEGTPEEALAAFYAYESQVPRVAGRKRADFGKCTAPTKKPADISLCTAPPMSTTRRSGGSNWPAGWNRIRRPRSRP